MASSPTLQTRPLTPEACAAFLKRQRLGRLAFSFRDRVDIRPIGYVYREGWLFGRTALGGKVDSMLHNRWVAFQVDQMEDLWNWTSVVVHGAFHLLSDGVTGEPARLREQAMEAIREEFPGALTGADPARERDQIFGIAVQEVSGLEAFLDGDSARPQG